MPRQLLLLQLLPALRRMAKDQHRQAQTVVPHQRLSEAPINDARSVAVSKAQRKRGDPKIARTQMMEPGPEGSGGGLGDFSPIAIGSGAILFECLSLAFQTHVCILLCGGT